MNTNQHNKELDRGTKPAQQNTNLVTKPTDGAYRQSEYIVAVEKYLGYEGLRHAVTDRQNDGSKYTFDFFQPEKKQFIKIFAQFDKAEYEKYKRHPSCPILILDGAGLPVRRKYDAEESLECLMVNKKVAEYIWEDRHTYIYADGKLWEHELQIPGWGWRPITELSVREMMLRWMQMSVEQRSALVEKAASQHAA